MLHIVVRPPGPPLARASWWNSAACLYRTGRESGRSGAGRGIDQRDGKREPVEWVLDGEGESAYRSAGEDSLHWSDRRIVDCTGNCLSQGRSPYVNTGCAMVARPNELLAILPHDRGNAPYGATPSTVVLTAGRGAFRSIVSQSPVEHPRAQRSESTTTRLRNCRKERRAPRGDPLATLHFIQDCRNGVRTSPCTPEGPAREGDLPNRGCHPGTN